MSFDGFDHRQRWLPQGPVRELFSGDLDPTRGHGLLGPWPTRRRSASLHDRGLRIREITLPSEKRHFHSLAMTVCMIFLGLGKQLDRRVEVFLIGHADKAEGRHAGRRSGERRAKSIQRFIRRQLHALLPGAGRLKNLRVTAHSCGHRHPAGSDVNENRRVEVFLFVEGKRCFFPREFPKCALQSDV